MKLLAVVLLFAGLQPQPAPQTPAPFHWHDDYTEYHLLAPGTNQFHIVYYLNQRQGGLTYVLNQTRSGSEGSGISVSDPRTGASLKFDYLTGKELADAGVQGRLSPEEHYIRAHLTRPVPVGGEGRVRIEKTYKDEKSYFASGETITFTRSLGIGRNAIILPAGYTLVSSNVAAMVESLGDGRIRLSFENINGYASDVNIRAAKGAAMHRTQHGGGATNVSNSTKTLYDLQADGTIRITHEFVQVGSLPSVPVFGNLGPHATMSAIDMDTGAALIVEPAKQASHAPAVKLASKPGEKIASVHIRVLNAFRDSRLVIRPSGFEWSRELGEPRATIVLPPGFELALANMPVTMGTLPDGRVYLQVVNNRNVSLLPLEIRGHRRE